MKKDKPINPCGQYPYIIWPCGAKIYVRIKPGTSGTIEYLDYCCYRCFKMGSVQWQTTRRKPEFWAKQLASAELGGYEPYGYRKIAEKEALRRVNAVIRKAKEAARGRK